MEDRNRAQELIDIAKVAHAAVLAELGPSSPVSVDTRGAALAPLALGDRQWVHDRIRRLIREVVEHPRPAASSGAATVTVSAWVTLQSSINVRVESGPAWRELRLPIAGAAPLDVPRLAQIERYGFLRLAPLAPIAPVAPAS